MNIQTRKLSLIEEFLNINDEELISKLESLIKEEKNKQYETSQTPMSTEEFRTMIDQSKLDSEKGRVISNEDLKKKNPDMEIKVEWSHLAERQLRSIFNYYTSYCEQLS